MNERIKELIKQSQVNDLAIDTNGDPYDVKRLDPEKFAELLIKETTNVIIIGHKGHMNPALATDSVKQHFGV